MKNEDVTLVYLISEERKELNLQNTVVLERRKKVVNLIPCNIKPKLTISACKIAKRRGKRETIIIQ